MMHLMRMDMRQNLSYQLQWLQVWMQQLVKMWYMLEGTPRHCKHHQPQISIE